MVSWIHLPINPDPWAIGPLGVGRRGGKYYPYVGQNSQLNAFKEAVKEELKSQGVSLVEYDKYSLTFYFWRRLESNTSGSRKNTADATNMQKALEDALQGILIGNDRDVLDIRSHIADQGSDTRPGIIIRIEPFCELALDDIPNEMWEKLDASDAPALFDNAWSGPGL